MSRRATWFVSVIPFLFCSCEGIDAALNVQRIRGSGNAAQEKREVSGFSAVNFGGSGELSIQQGNQESLTVEADDNILPYIRSDVENGRLILGFKRGVSVSTRSPIRFTLMVKELNGLELSGSGKTRTGPLTSQDFKVHLSGSGEIRIAALDAETLVADISGSGNMEIPGKVGRQQVHISGSGRYYAPELDSQSADVSVSGSGDCTLRVEQSLTAHISGSGSVEYYGNPSVTKKVSGSGKVSRLGDR